MSFICNNNNLPQEIDVSIISGLNTFQDFKNCTLVSKSLGVAVEVFASQKLGSWHCSVKPLEGNSFKRLLNLEHLLLQWEIIIFSSHLPIDEIRSFGIEEAGAYQHDFYSEERKRLVSTALYSHFGIDSIFYFMDCLLPMYHSIPLANRSQDKISQEDFSLLLIASYTSYLFPKHSALKDFRDAVIGDNIFEAIEKRDVEKLDALWLKNPSEELFEIALQHSISSFNFAAFKKFCEIVDKKIVNVNIRKALDNTTTLEEAFQILSLQIDNNIQRFAFKAAKFNEIPLLTHLKNQNYDFNQPFKLFTPLEAVTSKTAAKILLDRGANINNSFSLYNHLKKENFEIAYYLIENGAKLPPDHYLLMPLDKVLLMKDQKVREVFLEVMIPAIELKELQDAIFKLIKSRKLPPTSLIKGLLRAYLNEFDLIFCALIICCIASMFLYTYVSKLFLLDFLKDREKSKQAFEKFNIEFEKFNLRMESLILKIELELAK